MDILEIGSIDKLMGVTNIQIDVKIKDKEKEEFGKHIDGDEYMPGSWVVIVTRDTQIRGMDLYYISQKGLMLYDKGLTDIEYSEIEEYLDKQL